MSLVEACWEEESRERVKRRYRQESGPVTKRKLIILLKNSIIIQIIKSTFKINLADISMITFDQKKWNIVYFATIQAEITVND